MKLYLSGNEGGMKLLLFLRAGVSVPSRLPTAANLTDWILHGAYHHEGKGLIAPGQHSDQALRADDPTRRIERLLRLLIKHDTRDIKRVGYYVEAAAGGFGREAGAACPCGAGWSFR